MTQSREEIEAIRRDHYEKTKILGEQPPAPPRKRGKKSPRKAMKHTVTPLDRANDPTLYEGDEDIEALVEPGNDAENVKANMSRKPHDPDHVPSDPADRTPREKSHEDPDVDPEGHHGDATDTPAIPDNYEELSWNEQRALAKAIRPGVVANREAALDIIRGEIERRGKELKDPPVRTGDGEMEPNEESGDE